MFFFFSPPQSWQENILLQSQIAKHHLWKISFSLFSFIFLSTPATADRQRPPSENRREREKRESTSKQTLRSEKGFPFWVTDCTLSQEAASPAAVTHTGRHLRKGPRRGCSLSALLLAGLTHAPMFRWTGYHSGLFTLRGRSD